MALNKFSNEELGGLSNSLGNIKIIHIGEVLSVDDDFGAGRIKARIPGFKYDQGNLASSSDKNKKNKKYYKSQGSENKIEITNERVKNNLNNNSKNSVSDNVEPENITTVVYAIPLLPYHYQILPKVGEMVMIIVFEDGKGQLNRCWSGPLIPNKNAINFSGKDKAGSHLNSAAIPAEKNIDKKIVNRRVKKRGNFTGGFPEKYDIAIHSRDNADIVLPTKSDKADNITDGGEVLIRAGKFKYSQNPSNNGLELNDENPAYFRLKSFNIKRPDKINDQGKLTKQPQTHAMLFSDYITIVSHKNGEEGGKGITKINPILESDNDIIRVHKSLQPLVRGELLVEFLELVRDYIKNHNHPYHKLPATNANSKEEIDKFDIRSILSTNIRIN